MKYSFIKAIQYSKHDLDHYTFPELKVIARYLEIPVTISKNDMEWVIAIELLNKSYKSSNMPPKIKWAEEIRSEQEVPATEPETRKGLEGIEWPKLKYSNAARACLQRVMGKLDIWDVEELEELLNDPKKIAEKGIVRIQLIRLQSCLRILKDEATVADAEIIRRYYVALRDIRKRKRGPPPKSTAIVS